MGKPFKKEISDLEETYEWARTSDISKIAKILSSTWNIHLISVGSGGSYSAAELHANLHRSFFESPAHSATPMELPSYLPANRDASVWFMSASGGNIDIRRSFQHASLLEPKAVSCLVGRKESKISVLAAKYRYTSIFEHIPPCGKDGFLATNSLVGFSILMYRAYCNAANRLEDLPTSLAQFLSSRTPEKLTQKAFLDKTEHLWQKDITHIIYSPSLKAAAIDIESKFVEAGLSSIHIADLRNFAHGRHHWFSKNSNTNSILAITEPGDENLALRTLNALPSDIPKAQISIDNACGSGAIVGIILSIYCTHIRGLIRNIDPGRPRVPSYGSKIYRLTAKSGFIQSMDKTTAAIKRKTRVGAAIKNNQDPWKTAYSKFTKYLGKQNFGAVVLDYDGTLVDSRRRGSPPSKALSEELNRLLEIGITIGFATGRGKSIRKELQEQCVIKKRYWKNIIIGYYNGSEISTLADNDSPNGEDVCASELEPICQYLQSSSILNSLQVKITKRKHQITVEPVGLLPETFLWNLVKEQLALYNNSDVKVYRSSHSIDIVSKGVSKLSVVNHIQSLLPKDIKVMTIGDRGRWPGNDSHLLSTELSLSVDEVSQSISAGWNLCPAGIRGPQGTLLYLNRLTGINNIVRFK